MSYTAISILVIFLAFSANVYAKTNSVCKTCKFSDIQSGVLNTSAHDTLLIHSGEYIVDNILLEHPINIVGIDYPKLISKNGTEIITVVADSVSIIGLHLSGVLPSYLVEHAAIKLKYCKNFNIISNQVINCFFGIYLERAKFGLVQDNAVSGPKITDEASSGNAIHAWYCDSLMISNNHLSGHRDGIYLEFVNNSIISGNKSFENNRYGLHFMFSNDDQYFNNVFLRNGVGVAVMFSRRIKMLNNKFHENWGISSYGLLLKEINDAIIEGNDFHRNTIGVFVEGSNRINYRHNNFSRNGYGVQFSGGCMNNNIVSNNFVNNSLDIIVKSDINNNVIDRNYWSEYTGYDLNKDGVGDIPYYPIKLFSYIVERVPESIILMRSLFVDIVNFSEKVSPIFTPKNVMDLHPSMTSFSYDKY
ncbi:MAG: nitrous oxide reductase family maturation protein NosD [Bacteroidia bacterium]|nr:nitrous oxide reductase family maturation protein NosD [Bacteroidia bacterium]